MLKKVNRLTKKKDFSLVFKKGYFFREQFISIKTLKNELPYSRVGIIVGTKISKRAVRRNKIKRLLREVFRLKINSIKPGFDIVVIPNIAVLEKKFKEIQQAVDRVLIKSKLV